MSNDPPDDRDGSPKTTSFEEWIEQQAETKGVSRQELFEQLVSSYWTVNEMAELIDNPGDDAVLPKSAPDDFSDDRASDVGTDADPDSDSNPDSTSRAEDVGSELDDIDSVEELRNRLADLEAESEAVRSTGRSGGELIETLADRLTWLEADLSSNRLGDRGPAKSDSSGVSDAASARHSPATAELRDRVDALSDRLEGIEEDLADDQERIQSQDEFLEAVAERLSRIDARVDDLASEVAADRESLADRVDEVESDISDLDGDVEGVHQSLADRIEDLESDVEGRQRQLANEQERLRSRLNAEFDDLEAILEHLVNRADDLDAGLGAVEQRHDDELSRLRREREALQSVMSEAAKHDADVGECAVCGERVDLALLAEPYCPTCDSLLTGVETHDKWLFFSDVVVTAEENASGGRDRGGPTDRSGMVDPAGDSNGTTGSLGRADGTDPDKPGDRSRSEPVRSSPTRSTDSAPNAGSSASTGGQSGSDNTEDPAPIEFGSSGADTGGSGAGDDPADSQFSFGDLESATDSAADDDGGTSADSPFGDLEDLEREEQRNDGE